MFPLAEVFCAMLNHLSLFSRPSLSAQLHQVMCVAAPKIFGGAATVIIGMTLTRYLAAREFGVYALCLSSVLLVDAVLGAAIDTGLMRLVTNTNHAADFRFQQLALASKLGISVVFATIVFLFANHLSSWVFRTADAALAVRASCVACITLLLFRSAQAQLQIARSFALYGAFDVLHTTLKIGGVGWLILSQRVSPATILTVYAAVPLISFGVWAMTSAGRKVLRLQDLFDLRRRTQLQANGAQLFHFTGWIFLTFGLASVTARLDVWSLTWWSKIEDVGIFAAAAIVMIVPQMLGSYLAIVMSPRVMPRVTGNTFYALYRPFQLTILALCVATLIIAVPFINLVIDDLLPVSFQAARPVVLALLPGALAGLATFPLTLTFLMFMRPRFLLWVDIAGLPVVMTLYYFAARWQGAFGVACVTSAVAVTKATLANIVAWRIARTLDSRNRLASAPKFEALTETLALATQTADVS